MKKIIVLAAFVLSGLSTYAIDEDKNRINEDFNSIEIVVDQGEVEKSIYFSFSDSQEMKSFDINPYMDSIILDKVGEEFCTADLEVTVRIGIGSSWVQFKVTVKDVPCDEIVAKAKEIAAGLK
ncbi:MAG: hypothetical protein CMH48_07920 [Muricauda sp.]|nr:hypothetical protein [Allomuricauda sp.]MBC30760.1 hypothetical protein [Allomuricauda sp.]|tara:strand:- start:40219 stop:40587 length:369 start_codon:yes stop_codon:yes gene_type:complete